jgi:hypothetical protein
VALGRVKGTSKFFPNNSLGDACGLCRFQEVVGAEGDQERIVLGAVIIMLQSFVFCSPIIRFASTHVKEALRRLSDVLGGGSRSAEVSRDHIFVPPPEIPGKNGTVTQSLSQRSLRLPNHTASRKSLRPGRAASVASVLSNASLHLEMDSGSGTIGPELLTPSDVALGMLLVPGLDVEGEDMEKNVTATGDHQGTVQQDDDSPPIRVVVPVQPKEESVRQSLYSYPISDRQVSPGGDPTIAC